MITFLLIVTVVLLALRIKDTPEMMCEQKFYEMVNAQIAMDKRVISTRPDKTVSIMRGIVYALTTIAYVLLIGYYLKIGMLIGTSFMAALSLLQVASVICWIREDFKTDFCTKTEIELYKFRKVFFRLNLLLDYIYYPATIYYLIMFFI